VTLITITSNQALPPPTRLAGPLRRDLLRVSSGLGLGSGVHFSLCVHNVTPGLKWVRHRCGQQHISNKCNRRPQSTLRRVGSRVDLCRPPQSRSSSVPGSVLISLNTAGEYPGCISAINRAPGRGQQWCEWLSAELVRNDVVTCACGACSNQCVIASVDA
jgi:hypothetical protein